MAKLVGLEILVVDADPEVRSELKKLLESQGLVPTCTDSPAEATRLLREKFFAVLVCDLDTPEPGKGLELVRQAAELSPPTSVVVLTARKAYDAAVAAFRAGAMDVVAKDPSQVDHLRDRILDLASQVRRSREEKELLAEVAGLHEQILHAMMELFKEYLDLKDAAEGRTSQVARLTSAKLLFADPDSRAAAYVRENLKNDEGWHLDFCQTGGEVLDRIASSRFSIIVLSEKLPDLPTSMVANTIRSQDPDVILARYSPPGDEPGWMTVMGQSGEEMPVVEKLTTGKQLLEALATLKRAHDAKIRERRYLQAFRLRYLDLLKDYAKIRKRISSFLGGQVSETSPFQSDRSP